MGNECIDKLRLIGHLVRLPQRVGRAWYGTVERIDGDDAIVRVNYRSRRGSTAAREARVSLFELRLAAELPNGERCYIP